MSKMANAVPLELIEYLHMLARNGHAINVPPETTMADDPKKTGLDRKLASLTEAHELLKWTESFGCTEEQLKQAVKAVGSSAEKVREYLKRSG